MNATRASETELPPNKRIKLDDEKGEKPPDNHSGEKKIDCNDKDDVPKPQMDVLALVPPEIWLTIFKHLHRRPDDFLNVINSSEKLRAINSSNIAAVLFPKALPILAPYLTGESLLKCRHICKSWKKLVDTPLQNYPVSVESFQDHWWHSDSPFKRGNKLLEKRYLLDGSNIVEFMKRLVHENSIISRSVTIKLGPYERFQSDCEAAMMFLGKYGEYIWDFTLFCPSLERCEGAAVLKLAGMLRKLPNLRSLKIDWSTNQLSIVSRNVWEDLSARLPFISLPDIATINFDFRGGGSLEKSLGAGLIRSYGHQIETFICRGEFFEQDPIDPELITQILPKLRNLRIFAVTEGVLLKLGQFRQLPLHRLQLWYSFKSLKFGSLVRAINSFRLTLQELHMNIKLEFPHSLGCRNTENMVQPEEMNVKLEKVKVLSAPMSTINSNWFWDMTKLKFRNLEKIHLQTSMESLFAPYQSKYLVKEVMEAKQLFNCLNKLEKIHMWFHNEGHRVFTRWD